MCDYHVVVKSPNMLIKIFKKKEEKEKPEKFSLLLKSQYFYLNIMAQKHKSFSGFINIVGIPYSPNPTVSSIGLTEKKYC